MLIKCCHCHFPTTYSTIPPLSLPPLAGDGDSLGVYGALVGVEVEHLLLAARPHSHVQQVAADLQRALSSYQVHPTWMWKCNVNVYTE